MRSRFSKEQLFVQVLSRRACHILYNDLLDRHIDHQQVLLVEAHFKKAVDISHKHLEVLLKVQSTDGALPAFVEMDNTPVVGGINLLEVTKGFGVICGLIKWHLFKGF